MIFIALIIIIDEFTGETVQVFFSQPQNTYTSSDAIVYRLQIIPNKHFCDLDAV